MIETTIEDIMAKARELQAQGKDWHFHMLIPGCGFNKKRDRHAFVLEDETDGVAYVNYSGHWQKEQGKELVSMLHGKKIVAESTEQIADETINKILARAKELNEQGVHWHHHMLFPNCLYSKHPGKWVIIFEDPDGGTLESVSDDEPKESLRQIEVLYYAQKA